MIQDLDQNALNPLQLLLEEQQAAFFSQPFRPYQARIEDLSQLKLCLLAHKDELVEAMSADFGHRANYDSLFADVLPAILNINYSIKRIKRWMRPEKRHTGLLLMPAKVHVHYQPLGVVGIVVPWNFPLVLAISPLVAALAAGNRAMIKMSEFTPRTNQVLRKLLAKPFAQDQVAIVEGDADVASAFTRLPFDHLLFTGSTAVGRHVMRAAADNLTPVTLELGGKSPVLVGPDAAMEQAVSRMILAKCMNAGQICVAPDTVLVERARIDEFVSEFKRQFVRMYPEKTRERDYTHIVNERQWQRLQSWLQDAKDKGATVIPAVEQGAIEESQRMMVPHLILDTNDEMIVANEELFGPLLQVLPYDDVEQAFYFIRAQPRPLACYVMSHDPKLQSRAIEQLHAGGMCINDSLMQVAADDAPFGGIGPSGMGHYHGKEGFMTFSKAKTVLSRGRFNPTALVKPPYHRWWQKIMLKVFLR